MSVGEIAAELDVLPRWSVTDLFESLDSREFRAAVEQVGADVDRVTATFDHRGIRAIDPRPAVSDDGRAADEAHRRAQRTRCAPRSPRQLRLRGREHEQPGRAGPVAVRRDVEPRGPRLAARRPTGRVGQRVAHWQWRRRSPGSPQPGGSRALRAAHATRCSRRSPDERGRGGALCRTVHGRLVVVGQPAERRDLPAEHRGPTPGRTAAPPDAGCARPGHRRRSRRPAGRLRRRNVRLAASRRVVCRGNERHQG